jgi:hypothetical protein
MIIYPSTKSKVDLSNNTCTLELIPCCFSRVVTQTLPAGYDIEGIKLCDVDNHSIENLVIYIGNGIELKYEKHKLDNIELPEGGILASKILHHKFGFKFKISDEYVESFLNKDEYDQTEYAPSINLPGIEFNLRKNETTDLENSYTTPYWQKTEIDPNTFPKSYIDRIRHEYCFKADDETIDIDRCIQNKTKINGKVKLNITYKDGFIFKL